MSEKPNLVFPQAFSKQKDLTAFYRFINNKKTGYQLIEKSISKSIISKLDTDELLVAHDTSVIKPKSKVDKFFSHFSLLLDSKEDSRSILGPVNIHLWQREKNKKVKYGEEYKRWSESILETHKRCNEKKVIHLMDREGDSYSHFCLLNELNDGFVIRICNDKRVLNEADSKLYGALKNKHYKAKRLINISKRDISKFPSDNKIHPARKKRLVELGIKSSKIRIQRGDKASKDLPKFLDLNFVQAKEINPLKGEKPIVWTLATSEPIDNEEDVLRVIDFYRKRWLIEEFFKGLKTGCRLESRQFESLESWYSLICFLSMVAVQVVNLRLLSEKDQIQDVLNKTQMKILEKYMGEENKLIETIEDYKYSMAKLGGHIKCNGPPGWLVLSRGFEMLLQMEAGWKLRNM